MNSGHERLRLALWRMSVLMLGLTQVAAVVWLRLHSEDFVAAQLNSAAIHFSASSAAALATTLQFQDGSNDLRHLGAGWHPADDDGVWSRNREAWLFLPVPDHAGDLVLDLNLRAPPVRRSQEMTILLSSGRHVLEHWRIEPDQKDLSVRLPLGRKRLAGSVLDLHFQIDPPRSPWRQGIAADRRMLGVQLRSATILSPGQRAGSK